MFDSLDLPDPKWIAAPSTVFAGVVFAFGWLSTSPFAEWSTGVIVALCVPAMVAFVRVVQTAVRHRPGSVFMNADGSVSVRRQRWTPTPPRLSDHFSPVRKSVVIAVFVTVGASFALYIIGYGGSPDIVDGAYVLTDHGELVATVSRSDWLQYRTDQTRALTGHFLAFGVVGLLAGSATAAPPGARSTRPAPRPRRPSNRPGGRRRPQ